MIIESNCSTLVECVNNNGSSPWDVVADVEDIRLLMAGCRCISVKAVGRLANKAANWLAKSTLKGMSPLDWISCPPSPLCRILQVDAGFAPDGIG